MKLYFNLALMMILALLSSAGYATESQGLGLDWTIDPNDKSVEYLGQLFGPVGTALGTPPVGIMNQLVKVFNLAVVSLGAIVVAYTIVLSTMNTAQEGEIMGRQMSTLWVPMKAMLGVGMLMPVPTYSIVQIVFMHIVVMGIASANQIWELVLGSLSTTGIHGNIEVSDTVDATAKGLFKAMVCAEYLNKHAGLGLAVAPYVENGQVKIGTGADSPYCGTVVPNSRKPDIVSSNDEWIAANIAGIEGALSALGVAAQEVVEYPADSTQWSQDGVISLARDILSGAIASAPKTTTVPGEYEDGVKVGWLFAGSYYFDFTTQGRNYTGSNAFPSPQYIPADPAVDLVQLGDLGDLSKPENVVNQTEILSSRYATHVEVLSGVLAAQLDSTISIPQAAASNSSLSEFSNAFTGPLQDLAEDFMRHLTTGASNSLGSDPVASVRNVGQDIMITCEIIWFAIMIVAFFALLLGCIMSGINPICWALGAIGTILMPFLTFLLANLYVIGCVMGIYTPMVPYLVFTFTAIGWFMLVLESMFAAPIVALGIVSPGHEFLGRASPAVMLITGVFLRPSLMVIGFIAGVLLVRVVATMINFAFFETVEHNIAGVGLFGIIALICLYGGLILAIIHECFSLIYKLPDKILRWIGGQVEQSTVEKNVQGLEASTRKGAEAGSGLMKGTAQMAQDKILSKSMDNNNPMNFLKGGGGGMGF